MTPTSRTRASWYALACHVRSEARAAAELSSAGALGVDGEAFLPVRVERRAWSDRVKTVEVPLFPGYLFVRTELTPQRRVALLRASKAVRDVVGKTTTGDGAGAGAGLARAIPDDEVRSLRVLVAAERALDPIERLVRGQHVVIAAGALKGVSGVVEEGADRARRLVVQVTLLGRGVRTVLCADDVVEAPAEARL